MKRNTEIKQLAQPEYKGCT